MVRPRICVAVTAQSSLDALEAIRNISLQEPDIIELRLDFIHGEIRIDELRDSTETPLIATYRKKDEGGVGSLPEDERVSLLMETCRHGFNYVDLELSTDSLLEYIQEAKNLGSKIVLSIHDFQRTPSVEEMQVILYQMQDKEGDIFKIIGTANAVEDNLAYLKLLMDNPGSNLVTFCMGQNGAMSRIFSPLFGAEYTYASTERGRESAPGQMTLRELKGIYRALGM